MNLISYLSCKSVNLTASQQQSLSLSDEPVLMLAVPGAGKTTALVARTAALLDAGIPSERILNLTFSRAAATSMQQRFRQLFSEIFPASPRFSTIHSLCLSILRDFARQSGRTVPNIVGTDGMPTALSLLRGAVGTSMDDEALAELENWISFAKNRLLDPSVRPSGAPDLFPQVFERYEKAKKSAGLMDYDDMPLFAAQILQKRPSFLAQWQQRFIRINVDEAQDVSPAQYAVLRLLTPRGKGLFLVGDEDQSIYGFRGASPQQLLDFAESFPGAKIWKMEENFRSRPEILSCCNGFIRLCPQRYDKEILPTRQSGGCVEQVLPASMEDSLQEIAAIIRETLPGQTVGILYRNHLSAGPAALWLEKEHIPFQIDPAAFILGRGPVRMQQILLQLAANPGDLEAFRQLRFPRELEAALFQDVLLRANGKKNVPQLLRDTAERFANGGPARKLADTLETCKTFSPLKALEFLEHRTVLAAQLRKQAEAGDPAIQLREYQFRFLCSLAQNVSSLETLQQHMENPKPFYPKEAQVFLSTIHGAKGLEYDTVLLLDAFDGILPGRAALDALQNGDQEGWYEELRLFYVAATRAKERLVVFSAPKDAKGMHDSRFFRDFFRHRPRHIPMPLFAPGTPVFHRVFGSGTVIEQSGDRLTIAFGNGLLKSVSLSYCISNHLLKKT